MIHEYETELEYGRMRLTVQIKYSYDHPERQAYDRGDHYTPGHLYIENVIVVMIEGFDAAGEVAYRHLHDSITPERLEMLDDFAYSYVEGEVEGVGGLAETLIGAVS